MKKSLTLALAFALLGTSAAFAHAHLVSQMPAANAVAVAAPSELKLKFSESVSLKFTGVEVAGPDKSGVALGAASLDPKDNTSLTVPLQGVIAPGTYTVTWHAVATDGHKTQGSYTFTVK